MTSPARYPWAVLAHAVFLQLAAYTVRPTASYRALELGVEPALLGLVVASFSLLPLAAAVWVGRMDDAGHGRPLLLAGALLMVGSGVGLLLATPDVWWLLGWNALLGLGHLISLLGEQSRIAEAAAASGRRRNLDALFGLYTFAGSAGQALAPTLLAVVGGGSVLPETGPLFALYLAAAACMSATTLGMVVRRSGTRGTRRTTSIPLRQALAADPAVRRPLVTSIGVSMMVLCSIDLIQVYLPALGVERGIPASVVGALLTARALATMASRLALGRLVDRFGRSGLILWATAAGGAAVLAVAVPMPEWALGAVLVAAGYALGIVQPLTMTVVSLAAPPGTRGTWLAARITANRLGQAVIPPAVGLLAAGMGSAGVFTAAGVLLGASAAGWRAARPARPARPGP
ncbi:MFS transporter [Sinomonas flava]|uniref:MFS transporter n=1 Tax=Sinomonas flava TaxID=496857 RepID=UPI0039A6F658